MINPPGQPWECDPPAQDLPVLNSQEVQARRLRRVTGGTAAIRVAWEEPGVFVAAASQKDERKCRALLAHKVCTAAAHFTIIYITHQPLLTIQL